MDGCGVQPHGDSTVQSVDRAVTVLEILALREPSCFPAPGREGCRCPRRQSWSAAALAQAHVEGFELAVLRVERALAGTTVTSPG